MSTQEAPYFPVVDMARDILAMQYMIDDLTRERDHYKQMCETYQESLDRSHKHTQETTGMLLKGLLDGVFTPREPATFTVSGSAGQLTVSVDTGDVLEYAPDGDNTNYDDISKLDVAEWRETYPGQELAGKDHDILDFGCWGTNGYEEPEHEWRKEMRSCQ